MIWISAISLIAGYWIGNLLSDLKTEQLFKADTELLNSYLDIFDEQQEVIGQQNALLNQLKKEKTSCQLAHYHLVSELTELKQQHERTLAALN